jgi:ubiquinone biosynthesis protein UbiJ
MLAKLAITGINLALDADLALKKQVAELAPQIIEVILPGLSFKVLVAPDGSLLAETAASDTTIVIPVQAATYLLNHDQFKTFQALTISGNTATARQFLSLLIQLKPSNILYQTSNPLLGVALVQLEGMLTRLRNYLQLVTANCSLSLSEYVQYEANAVGNKFELDQYCSEVDDLAMRVELLNKRIERLMAKQ